MVSRLRHVKAGPLGAGNAIVESVIIIKCGREDELVSEIPSCSFRKNSSCSGTFGNWPLGLLCSRYRRQTSLFRVAPPFDWK